MPPLATSDNLRIEIASWIERAHQRRKQVALGGLTPIGYETIIIPQTATAAWPTCHLKAAVPLDRCGLHAPCPSHQFGDT